MDWESLVNTVDYHVRERYLSPWCRAWTDYWRAGRQGLFWCFQKSWLLMRRPRKETPLMDAAVAPVTPALDLPVLGRAILSRMDSDARQAIDAATREELAEEVHAQAVAEARAELDTEYESRRIRLQDQVAAAKDQAEADAELRIESAIAKGLEARQAELDNDLLDLRAERDEARHASEATTDTLLSLVRQIIPTRKTYLHSRGILELDLYRLNAVLRPHGLRVRSEAVPGSKRQVSTLLTADRSEPRALFWTEAVKGAADEDEPLIDGIPARFIVRP
jgi:hypothetical protein